MKTIYKYPGVYEWRVSYGKESLVLRSGYTRFIVVARLRLFFEGLKRKGDFLAMERKGKPSKVFEK